MLPPLLPPPTHSCPKCDRVAGGFREFRVEHIRHVGWELCQIATYVNWCGHGAGDHPVAPGGRLGAHDPGPGRGAVEPEAAALRGRPIRLGRIPGGWACARVASRETVRLA